MSLSPILVTGMHRSGTRLVADLLADTGVFMGADRQADSESVAFMRINEGVLHQCGAFWSEPMSAHFFLSQPDFVESIAESTRTALMELLPDYLGTPVTAGIEAALSSLQAFGWKDPRNGFTLPVWRRIFPELRVVNVIRHGVDVAASLSRRHAEALRAAQGGGYPPALTVIQDRGPGVLSSRRGWTLPEAFAMWEQYVEKAELEIAELKQPCLRLRFEDVIRDPGAAVQALADFAGQAVPAATGPLTARVVAARSHAWRADPALVEFAASVRTGLERHGYSAT